MSSYTSLASPGSMVRWSSAMVRMTRLPNVLVLGGLPLEFNTGALSYLCE